MATTQSFGARHLFLCFMARYTTNINLRTFIVFAPFIAEEWNIDLSRYPDALVCGEAAAMAVSAMALLMGQVSPRQALVGSELIAGVATLVLALQTPSLVTLCLARFAFGAARAVLAAAVVAAIAQGVPEDRRGRAIGVVEVSWWMSGLTLPIVGPVIEQGHAGLNQVLLGLAAIKIALGFATYLCFSDLHDCDATKSNYKALVEESPDDSMRACVSRMTLAKTSLCLSWHALFNVAGLEIMTVLGIWWHTSFKLSAAAVGFSGTVLAVGEITGALANMLITDCLGGMRTVFGGTCGMMLAYIAMAASAVITPESLPIALVVSCSFQGMLEISALAGMVWVTLACPEGIPQFTMTLVYRGVAGIGKCVGIALAVPLFMRGGIILNACVAAAVCAFLLGFVWAALGQSEAAEKRKPSIGH